MNDDGRGVRQPQPPKEGSYLVYYSWRRGFGFTRRSFVRVELPAVWARPHQTVVVGFNQWGEGMGWHTYLVGEEDEILLSFPWHDHADRTLAGEEAEEFPITAAEEEWEDVEQEWFAWVMADGDDVYTAEGSSDDMSFRVGHAPKPVLVRPGVVSVDGCEVTWNRTSRVAYDRAWANAVASCREGRPAPVGVLSASRDQLRIREAPGSRGVEPPGA